MSSLLSSTQRTSMGALGDTSTKGRTFSFRELVLINLLMGYNGNAYEDL